MKIFKDLRVGYLPYTPTFEKPGDRRRFWYYAQKRNIKFEIARPTESYDLVVLSEQADISVWSKYPAQRGKVVFDLIDSYLAIPPLEIKGLLRGAAKFAFGQHKKLRLSYRRVLEEMCRRADATICCTEEQKQCILPLCKNIHMVLDFHNMVVRSRKENYSAGEVFHFVWEGLPVNIFQLMQIKEVLQDFGKKRPFVIHVITDLEYGRFLSGRFGRRQTMDDVRKILPNILLYAWHEHTMSAIARTCDLALLPVPLNDPLVTGKPENRLLLFWRLGVPAIVSATPAHLRAMQDSGVNMACRTPQEWREMLDCYAGDDHARKRAALAGMAFAESQHSEEKTLALWDQVLSSVLGEPAELEKAAVSVGQR
jgi:hypothetical protein